MGYYGRSSRSSYEWPAYVSVAERKAKALKHANALKKKGVNLNPVAIEGRTIAKSFWGKAWCDNLEAYSDYSNRLPRGRTYVRNGSVIDLQVSKGKVEAQVMGSSLYKVAINVKPMPDSKWQLLVKACAGKIDSLIELLQGKFSKGVMEIITQKEGGLFPKPQEISMKCSCPDSAGMCKHIAAVLYGVGATLDAKPEWLFDLRFVDQGDLIATASGGALLQVQEGSSLLEDDDLSSMFGIEMDSSLKKVAPTSAAKKAKAKIKSSLAIPEPIVKPVKTSRSAKVKGIKEVKAKPKKASGV